MKPERPEDQNSNNEQDNIAYQEKGLENTMEKITHWITEFKFTKLQKFGYIISIHGNISATGYLRQSRATFSTCCVKGNISTGCIFLTW
jgi:hypothetical protein